MAKAQDEFERIEVLDKPKFSLNNRIVLDTEFTFYVLDAYFKPMLLDLAASYQFSDFFAWEVIRAGLPVINLDTGLVDDVESQANNALQNAGVTNEQYTLNGGDELRDFKYRLSSTAFLNLLYSKSNWFNRKVVYHFWQVGAGMMYIDLDKEKQIGPELAFRVRFFFDNNWMLNLRGTYGFGFNKDVPRNFATFGVGGGFAF